MLKFWGLFFCVVEFFGIVYVCVWGFFGVVFCRWIWEISSVIGGVLFRIVGFISVGELGVDCGFLEIVVVRGIGVLGVGGFIWVRVVVIWSDKIVL